MYSIQICINHKKKELVDGDKDQVGVLRKDQELSFVWWGGFTDSMQHPIKLDASGYKYVDQWVRLENGEYLLGSYKNGYASAYLPFRVI